METLQALRQFAGKKQIGYPDIQHNNLFKRIVQNFYFELYLRGDKFLFSPYYSLIRGDSSPELEGFVDQNEEFMDSLKEFISASLYVYSAVVEENAYYLCNGQDVIIARLLFREHGKFEVKFYSHVVDELLDSYNDKIYIGRIFIDLSRFEREYFGLNEYFLSILEQNNKIQERARHKLRYYDDYKNTDLQEIDYLCKEVSSETLERLKLFPRGDEKSVPTIKLVEAIDNLFYIQNLLIELRDFSLEFEGLLRQREENSFVKYLTKFSKDLVNDINYLTKLYYLFSQRVAKFSQL